ncbi:hypothetical protein BG004_004765 [Podila humilis]|nr:hypothetical protein BG004_004765 [Podila humilis]
MEEDDLTTLVVLLRVNKHVCLTTLPFIYESPFPWLRFAPSIHRSKPDFNINDNRYHMIRLLMRSLQNKTDSGLLTAMFDLDSNDAHQVWPIDYLSYVRCFEAAYYGSSCLFSRHFRDQLSPRLRRYLVDNDLIARYRLGAVGAYRSAIGDTSARDTSPNTIGFMLMDLHRDLTWTLCQPILEQFVSITIPVSDIQRYLPLVHRFSSLKFVTFQLDGIAQIEHFEHYATTDFAAADHALLRERMEKRREDLEMAIQFLSNHSALFRGGIQQVIVPKQFDWTMYPQCCPPEYLDRMLALMPGLVNPNTINELNWKQFVATLDRTDMDKIESFESINHEDGLWYKLFQQQPPFLHRCRALRDFNSVSFGPNSFKLLNREIKYSECYGQEESQSAILPAAATTTNFPTTESLLPFLEHVMITARYEQFGSELDDIARFCGKSLRTFKIEGHYLPGNRTTQVRPVKIGDGWVLPKLQKLVVTMNPENLILDPHFLLHCPSLETIYLKDYYGMDGTDRLVKGTNPPGCLPKLKSLRLDGAVALSFPLDTLHTTKVLETLVLRMSQYQRSFPPLWREMRAKPFWTWDWHLPQLKTLDLTGIFAIQFRFQMLRDCPSLEELFLDIQTITCRSDRVLEKADFYLLDTEVDIVGAEDARQQGEMGDGEQDPVEDDDDEADSSSISLATLSSNELERILALCAKYRQELALAKEGMSLSANSLSMPIEFTQEDRLMEQRRSVIVMADYRMGRYGRESWNDPSVMAEKTKKTRDEIVEEILDELKQESELQSLLDLELGKIRQLEVKKRREAKAFRLLRRQEPTLVVAPSVKKLLLYGQWTMDDEVLELIFGKVLRNLEEINSSYCLGFQDATWIRVRDAMPWLKSVNNDDIGHGCIR